MVEELTDPCWKRGFNLSKWKNNSHRILASTPGESRIKEVKELDLDKDSLPPEKALGLQWRVDADQFTFRATAQTRGQEEASCQWSVPVGFLVPFALSVKLLLQEWCKRS